MSRPPLIDDELCESVLAGTGPVPHGLWDLAAFADDAREVRTRPAPVPDAVLRAMFDAPAARPRAVGSARVGHRAGAGARVAVGVSAAFMALTGAAAAGVLPSPAQHAVATLVNSMSPFPDFPDTSADDSVVTSATGGGSTTGATTGASAGSHATATGSGPSASSPLAAAASAAAAAKAFDPASTPSSTPADDDAPEWAPASGAEPPRESGDTGQDRAAITPSATRPEPDPQGNAEGHDQS